MTESIPLSPPHPSQPPEPPEARTKRWLANWIWLVPLAALVLVGYLGYEFLSDRGPMISITFATAEGLQPKQTEVRYRAVTLGRVEEVRLSEDRSHVVARVRMNDQAETMLTDEARFWVVRPRLQGGLRGLTTGLQTLVSGAYIAMDPGNPHPDAEEKHQFEGLEEPPSMRSNEPGTVYFLRAERLGSLSSGAPVFYRNVEVGEVLSHYVEPDASGVRFRIFVKAPYDGNIVEATRFWNASGIEVADDQGGLNIEILSPRTLFSGGIAFDTPSDALDDERAAPESIYQLYESEARARVSFYGGDPYVSYFQTSVRGLGIGSEVHMYGRRIGAVTNVALARDPREGNEGQYAVRVEYLLQPARALPPSELAAFGHDGIEELVDRNLRVVLQTTNMLTGQKALSLEHVASTEGEPVDLRREEAAMVLPSRSADLGEITSSLASIFNEVEQIPFADIGRNLDRTLVSIERGVGGPELQNALVNLNETLEEAQQLVAEARAGLGPALQALPRISTALEETAQQAQAMLGAEGYGANSQLHRDLERMMDNIAEAARSIRLLAEHLERHPESLVVGRGEEDP